MKVLLTLGCLLWERVQREVKGNRTQQQTKRYILCWLYPIIKCKTPVFSQLTYMCFYIYTGSFLRLRPRPSPRGATSRSRPRCLPRGSESRCGTGTGQAGATPSDGLGRPAAELRSLGRARNTNRDALRTPAPCHRLPPQRHPRAEGSPAAASSHR